MKKIILQRFMCMTDTSMELILNAIMKQFPYFLFSFCFLNITILR